MQYRYQPPSESLTPFIRTLLILEGNAQPGDPKLPLFTNGMPAMLCRIENDPALKENKIWFTLYGKSTPSENWDTGSGTTIIAYFFKPFTMPVLFNLPANQLKEEAMDLATWNPHVINALRIQLTNTNDIVQQVHIIDHFLTSQFQQQQNAFDIIQDATETMIRDSDKDVLPSILDHLQLNERTFQRMFKKYLGITPTQFRRICQFQVSFAQLRAGEFDNITEVVYDNGFADQSHFIRAFKEYTQTTPQHYLRHGLKDKKT